MNQSDITAAVVGFFLMLGGGKKKAGAATSKPNAAPPVPLDPDADGVALMKRANQAKASAWATVFVDHPVSPLVAAALARWAGIESSGNPMAVSRLGERGLMQAGPQTVEEGGLSPALWAAMVDPKTTRKVHADIAIAYVDWLAARAAKHLAHDPTDPVDRVWYAKLYHQRPVDVRDAHLSGVALDDARHLAEAWAGDAKAMHRLRAANVIAWGTPTP
jgi:hypothetical protein